MQTTPDQDKDVLDFLVAVVREAHRQADMVAAYLESIGFLPPQSKRQGKTWFLPPDLLLKMGAMLKLAQWSAAGITPHPKHALPTWQEVEADVIAETRQEPTRFSGKALSTKVLMVFVQQICWTPLESMAAEVAVEPKLKSDDFLEELAQMLWDNRHLAWQIGENNGSETKE